METNPTPNPCEIPCPKCGSALVVRNFYAKGAEMRSFSYGERPSGHCTGPGTYYWTSTADHILNHCSCCKYEWDTMPLKVARKTTAQQV